MDLQPMIAAPALLALLAGCAGQQLGRSAFDGPSAVAWLPPGEGPFDDAVAFVANSRSGTIVPLDVKHAALLSDSPAAPFLDPRWVATGDTRTLGALAAWSPDGEQVVVFAADLAHEVLVEAPWIVGVADDGTLEVQPVTATTPMFVDADESGDFAGLAALVLEPGATTTEDWVLEYDGEAWWVTGSRSGLQNQPAHWNELYRTDREELTFQVVGTATAGDRIELSTDAGVVEHDLGGQVLSLLRVPGTSWLVAGAWSGDDEQGRLAVWDMEARAELASIALPEGAQPYVLAPGETSEDGAAWTFFVGDARVPEVLRVDLDLADPASSAVEAIDAAGPVSALAYVADPGDELFGREPYRHLFVAPAGENRVDVYDLDAGAWLDVNPDDDVEGGVRLASPVVGLSASTEAVGLQQHVDFGAEREDRVVVVTTFDGAVMMYEGRTGCLATTEEGAHEVEQGGTGELVTFSDRGASSNPEMVIDSATGRAITPSSCGGVTRSETWTVTYDGVEGSWLVEGSTSGEQEARAWEDERYVSDDGAVSFIIRAGTLPSTDGDRFTFTMDDGVLRIDAVSNRAGTGTVPLELPAPPLVVEYDAGPTGGGWDEDRRRVMALVPVTNTDAVLRVRLDAWDVRALWD